MEKSYTSAVDKGVKNPVVAMTGNEPTGEGPIGKGGKEIETPGRETRRGAYLRGQKGGALDKPNKTKGGAITVVPKEKSLVTKSIDFAKKNPALSLLSLDAIRKFLPSRSPFGAYGGRVGSRSAPS